ncbi:MAG: hypothetical protein JO129_02455 [Candidatus Dependentiae bacterium]|nr:hypothetical protein [Candidatus Dependentiae bacterium]
MFKKIKMMIVIWYGFSAINIDASLQVAIAARDFCVGNSLVLIARDGNGLEQVAGCVSLVHGKTQFTHDEISCYNRTLSSLTSQKSAIIADVKQDHIDQNNETLIYLYFEVDPKVNIVRVLVIKNSFLADNPFDVLEFSTSPIEQDEDEDDFFGDQSHDELSNFKLTDLEGTMDAELSSYDKIVLSIYALWTIQSSHAKQAYKNFTEWILSEHAK